MKKKLLLADDSITIQKVVQITFSHDDYDLTVVDNGEIAYEKARLQRPDLILADVFMPGKNGYELCAAVKNDPALATVPVLLLTGTFEPFDEAKARSVGADRWIAKPFESQALISCVEELLTLAAQAPSLSPPPPAPPVAPPAFIPTPVPAPVEVVEFAQPDLAGDLSDDIWGSDFSAESTIVSSDLSSDDSFAVPSQDDLWDVSGFETEIPVANAAESEDLWGSFESTPSAVEVSAPTTAPIEADSWESDDFSSSFAAEETVVSDSFAAGLSEVPLSDAVEILEEIDLLEPIADTFTAEDFSFEEELVQPEEAATLIVPVAPLPVPPVATPLPLPVVEVSVPLHATPATDGAVLSDAQLDLLAERVAGLVVTRLSGTLLEKIAWEVVPDLAETMIKEELRKIRESVAAG